MTLHHSHCDVFGAENEKNYFILALKTNLCLFSGVAFVSPQRAVGYTHQQLKLLSKMRTKSRNPLINIMVLETILKKQMVYKLVPR